MRSVALLAGWVLVAGIAVCAGETKKLYSGDPIKVLLVTGGGAHDYKNQATIVPEIIKARGDFTVTVIGPNWKEAKVALAKEDWAKGHDVVVYNMCDAFCSDKELIHNIAKVHLEGTTPAVIIHGTLHSFHWKVGKIKNKYEEGEEWVKVMGIASASHGRKAAITVKTVKEDHPIMKDLPKEWKTPAGELYNSHDVLPSATPLAMGDNGDKKQGPQVCIWVNQCGKARVFGTSIGHHNETMKTELYGDMLVRGLLWACDKLK
jgi:type 1 glutamine amidotransferase